MSTMPDSTPTPTPAEPKWTVAKIRELTQKKFGKRACWFQVKVAQALYSGKDVVGCAPTGAGKTLSFWIPLLMALEDGKDKMSIVVTPLNLLGKQNVKVLEEAGLPAIAVSKENANKTTFKDIENGKYRVVVINGQGNVTDCDQLPLLAWVPGYGDHRIQSLPASLSRGESQSFIYLYLQCDKHGKLFPSYIPSSLAVRSESDTRGWF